MRMAGRGLGRWWEPDATRYELIISFHDIDIAKCLRSFEFASPLITHDSVVNSRYPTLPSPSPSPANKTRYQFTPNPVSLPNPTPTPTSPRLKHPINLPPKLCAHLPPPTNLPPPHPYLQFTLKITNPTAPSYVHTNIPRHPLHTQVPAFPPAPPCTYLLRPSLN